MSRYFSGPIKVDEDWFAAPLLPDIHVPEHQPIKTGLLDVRGAPIMRAPNPMGFGHGKDRQW